MSVDGVESTRKYLWDYFQLHATQRLSTFNFYIVLSTLISTGLFTTFREHVEVLAAGPVLGFMLIYLSFVFWKLDERNKNLIKRAETALKVLEQQMLAGLSLPQADLLAIFSREALETEVLRCHHSTRPWSSFYSYSDCFRFIFILFASIGLLGSLFSSYLLFR